MLHFSESHDNYYSAYKYITKSDGEVFHSNEHPNLKDIGSPKTKNCVKAYRASKKRKSSTIENGKTASKPKQRRLSNLDVSEFMIENKIATDTELFATANEQKEEGKKDLANFILSRSKKSLSDLIENTWKMNNASSSLQRKNVSRMERIHMSLKTECDVKCNGQWIECAKQVLQQNGIYPHVFATSLRTLLTLGRGKHRNIIIVGPANCAKTFLLSPIQKIYEAFSNPATDKYAWLGAEKSEAIFLNDFRWSSELIAWKEFLLLLEGQTVHLPSPKNHYSSDTCINSDVPVFATSKSPIVYVGKYNSSDDRETEMMAARWKVFTFYYQIPQHQQKEIPPCMRCFAELVLLEATF